MELISVIVPVYQSEPYLRRCVESLCRQTHQNLEILLVDDGSPDRSGILCEELAAEDSRIRVIHQDNGGLSAARNTGIDCAKGAYLAFLDSDDWYDPTMLSMLYRLITMHNAGIAECSYRNILNGRVQAETACTGAVMEFTPVGAIESCLDWKYCKPVAWNKLYRREVIGSVRYPVGKIHEDEFTTHLYYLNTDKIVYLDMALVNYERRNTGSITASFRPANLDACEAFLQKVRLIWSRPDLRSLDRKACSNYCYVLLDRVKRAEASCPACDALHRAIRDAAAVYPQLCAHGIDEHYRKELTQLFAVYSHILEKGGNV